MHYSLVPGLIWGFLKGPGCSGMECVQPSGGRVVGRESVNERGWVVRRMEEDCDFGSTKNGPE